MKSNILILLLSFVAVLSAAAIQGSNARIAHLFTPQNSFFDNKELLKYLLEFLNVEPSFRLISKEFKVSHDQYCFYYLAKIDSRLRNYLINIRTDITDQFIPSLVCPTLKLEAPLYYLFKVYLEMFARNIPQSSNQIQNEVVDAFTLRRADVAEGRRFIKDVMSAFTDRVFSNFIYYPKKIAYLYILTKSCFNTHQFKQLGFPIEDLLLDAVRGLYPDSYGEEIVQSFDTDFSPKLVHEALKCLKLNLARIILNKPGASNILATYTDPPSLKTTLHYCASVGAVDLIDRCLQMGADPLSNDSGQFRPINYAVINGHFEATRRLLEFDQNVLVSSTSALSPILLAIYNGRSDIIELFLSNPNITLIGNPLLSNELAEIVLNADDARMAQILFESGKLELSDQILNSLYLLSLRIE